MLNRIYKFGKYNKRNISTLVYNGGIESERIYDKKDISIKKVKDTLNDKKIGILGYGTQGRAQALNLRDSEFDVSVGLRKNSLSWSKALNDGFEEGKTLFAIDEVVNNSNIIMNLLSDAGQMNTFDIIKNNIKENDTLYFNYGFNIVFSEQTNFDINELPAIDVIMVAPKGSGNSVRNLFLKIKV